MIFEFITTTDCNWNCAYCSFPNVPNHTMTKDIIDRHSYIFDIMDLIRPIFNVEVICYGGEIGLVESSYLLRYLFQKINQPVIINTNGTFFDTDRSMLDPYIDKVYWHVCEDPSTNEKVPALETALPVIPGIVGDDADAIKSFIKCNQHLKFSYVEYEFIKSPPKSKDLDKRRSACWTLNPFISIDLAREQLLPCGTRGATAGIELNEKNLINVLTGFGNFPNENIMCNTCYRMCTNHNLIELMEQKRKLRDIL